MNKRLAAKLAFGTRQPAPSPSEICSERPDQPVVVETLERSKGGAVPPAPDLTQGLMDQRDRPLLHLRAGKAITWNRRQRRVQGGRMARHQPSYGSSFVHDTSRLRE